MLSIIYNLILLSREDLCLSEQVEPGIVYAFV